MGRLKQIKGARGKVKRKGERKRVLEKEKDEGLED